MPPRPTNIDGQTFGRLTVVHQTVGGSHPRYLCRCACDGKEVDVDKGNLTAGRTRSCGCLLKEWIVETKTIHGHARKGQMSPEYRTWAHIHSRCTDPNAADYPRYGARGIRIDPRWNDFEAFLSDMGPKPSRKHSIDRIDNDGPYSPENCRWATLVEQANNMRSNRRMTIGGQNRTIAEHARDAGIDYKVLWGHIEKGWPPEFLAKLLDIYRSRKPESAGQAYR